MKIWKLSKVDFWAATYRDKNNLAMNLIESTILAVHWMLSSNGMLDPSIMTESMLHLQLSISNTIPSSSTLAWSSNNEQK